MSDRATDRASERAVFDEVDPDPDAVIDAYGADSPSDLVSGAGDHDPVWEGLDTDAAGVADVVGDLTDETLHTPAGDDDRPTEPDAPSEPDTRSVPDTSSGPDEAVAALDEAIFASEPSTSLVEGDGDRIDRIVGERTDRDANGADEPTLVGPDPDPVRIPSDASEWT